MVVGVLQCSVFAAGALESGNAESPPPVENLDTLVVFNPTYQGPQSVVSVSDARLKKKKEKEQCCEKVMQHCGLPCIFWCLGAILCCKDTCRSCCKKS